MGIETEEEREMKHKHAEMIKTKADNMELVLFSMSTGSDYGKWSECKRETMPKDNENIKYFLCLPQHKEACLHWLNGGDVDFNSEFMDEWTEYEPFKGWGVGSVFMQDDYKIRIKPKKEKRWIAVNSDGYVMPVHCGNIESARQHASHIDSRLTENVQFIEIEVEV